jgi:hypothetical protein
MPAGGRTVGAAPIAPSDVKSNAQPISGRLYVIVLDDLNVSAFRSQVVVKAAREFIERYFTPNDIAAVTYTSGRTDGAQEFTSDKALLLAAINKFQGASPLHRARKGRLLFPADGQGAEATLTKITRLGNRSRAAVRDGLNGRDERPR